MGLLDGQISDASRLKQVVGDRIINRSMRVWQFILSEYQAGYGDVWRNPEGMTPQQVLDSIGPGGTLASDFVDWSIGLYKWINTVKPGTLVLPAPKPITKNPDGTVTVGA